MIGSNRFSAAFGNITSTPDPDGFRRFMRSAARDHRFALVFCETGTKLPVCTLSSVARKKADEEVQQSARAAGDRKWATRTHACGIAHATTDSAEIDKYLQRRFKNGGSIPNVAIEVGASRMLAIDVDTADELAAWAASWEAATGKPWPDEGLTVRSPGVRDNGVWKHSGGGHVWIDLEPVELTTERQILIGAGAGVFKNPGAHGWTAMYRDRYVLVPPSVRPEGPYLYNSSPVADNVDWLLATVAQDAVARETARMETAERRATRLADPGTMPSDRALIEWSQSTPWHELLSAQGWVDTGLAHACGCPDWTMAPVEDHGSPRSATAHEDGCRADHYANDEGHAPLHLWSDTRPPFLVNLGPTMTKLQFVTAKERPASRHGQPLSGEDIAAGMRALGLSKEGGDLRPLNAAEVIVAPNPATAAPLAPELVASAVATLTLEPATVAPTADVEPEPEPGTHVVEAVTSATGAPAVPSLGTFGVLPDPPAAMAQAQPVAAGAESGLVTGYQTEKHFLDLGSLLALPKKTPLVKDVLDLDSLARVFGPSGHGKTFAMVDLAMSVATGRPWAGFDVPAWGKVVYLAAEDATGVGQRIAAWCRKKHLTPEQMADVIHRIRVIAYPVQANNAEWDRMIADTSAFGPALVVIDTQAQTSLGYEENSNTEMSEYTKRLDQIRANTGACVTVVHHTGKDGKEARGAYSVFAALDAEYKVSSDKKPGGQTITVRNTKAKNRAEWPDVKTGALVVEGNSAVMSFDPTAVPDANAARAREEVSTGALDRKLTDVLSVLQLRRNAGITKTSWAAACQLDLGSYADSGKPKVPAKTADRYIDQLMGAGKVFDADGHTVGQGMEMPFKKGMLLFPGTDTESPEDTRTE